jgi:hypothetical protein
MSSLILGFVIAASAILVSVVFILRGKQAPRAEDHSARAKSSGAPAAEPPSRDPRIEGYWCDTPRTMPLSNNATAISIMKIEYGADGYRVCGTSHRVDGTQVAAWASDVAMLKDSTLYYFYRAGTEAFLSGLETGAAQITFAPDGNGYHGVLQIFSDKPQMVQLLGQRIARTLLTKVRPPFSETSEQTLDHERLARELLDQENLEHKWMTA